MVEEPISMMDRLKIVVILCAVMIGVYILDFLTGGFLKSFGVHPRNIDSIYTIFSSPWLHGDITHLLSNLSAMAVLAFLTMLQGVRYFVKASFLIIIVSGLLLWLFGRDANHIGASGWIFGLWSLTIALAWFERSFQNIAVGIGVIFFYGGMILGLLPTQSYISFESHIFGALAGIIAAGVLAKQRKVISGGSPSLKNWP